ncbi:hypothetical protein [Primorskyibacter flagellatus]|uniref:Uncharacterized protein n=1 Tax=Primorskyibacter flagellatus TaxID=1387277 RepID=A0A1W2E3Z7_9RHOB|nr:hypothetical protein [Primorskyibacter flagellatus]SMD04479.1 hypothetical protein SAMN06295998_1221 [Primorskyibacter flagellatus]
MNLEEIQNLVSSAVEPGYRGKLLARGQARAMIWRDGLLPEGAPDFISTLSYDLLSYGHSLLLLGIRLREEGGDQSLMRSAFEHAGEAIEAVVSKGDPDDPRRGFFRLLAASSFHLASLSARAFSLLHMTAEDLNLSRMERGLAMLILRALDDLEGEILTWRLGGMGSEEAIIADLAQAEQGSKAQADSDPLSDALDRALCDAFYGGLGAYILALETGAPELVEHARGELTKGLESAATLNMVPQWWCFRIAIHLLDDLWNSSFHAVLPPDVIGEDSASWVELRSLFITSLIRRKRSEIELWPSQIEGAQRSVDEVLQSSLWQRCLLRHNEDIQHLLTGTLKARANIIWGQTTAPQRRGYFLAGVGLHTGQRLDAVAKNANDLLIAANAAILNGDQENSVSAIVGLAETIFDISPFIPDPFPDNWREVLSAWLLGQPLSQLANENTSNILRFVENGLIYKLPWGIDAIRVRAQANGDTFGEEGMFTIDDFEVGLAVPAIETGTLNVSAATLMQAGFNSRQAAIKVVHDTDATFLNSHDLKEWLDSELVQELNNDDGWPTPESRGLWLEFITEFVPPERSVWKRQDAVISVSWIDTEQALPEGSIVRVIKSGARTLIFSPSMKAIGEAYDTLARTPRGVLIAKTTSNSGSIALRYFGPEPLADLFA